MTKSAMPLTSLLAQDMENSDAGVARLSEEFQTPCN